MAGDAATNLARRTKPSEDQLAQIDAAAEDNTWHEAPNLSKENLKSQMQATYNKNKPFGKEGVKDAAAVASQETSGSTDPAVTADSAADGTVGRTDAVAGAAAGAEHLKDQASANEIKEKANEKRRQLSVSAKNYLAGKMPEERREQTIWRLKKMVVEIQGHSDCMYCFGFSYSRSLPDDC
jgi:hypothetical protein